MTRAFGYARLSKDDERSTSIARQKQEIARWCDAHGATLVETFVDPDFSAYKRRVRRPGFERMLSRLGEVDTVVTWKLDRLARSVVGFNKLLETFEQAGVDVATTDGAVDMTTASGRAMVQMTAVFAELEAATTSERVKAMHAHKKEQGEWMGQTPFGWRRPMPSEETTDEGLVPVPEEQAEIEDIARRYTAGESLRAIAKTTRHTHPNLARILRTDRVLEALPLDLASRLAVEMSERGRTGTTANPSLLGGIGRCAECGGSMTVVAQRVRPNGKPWAAYACRDGKHVYISKPWLDEHVSAAVLAAIDTDRLAKRMARHRRHPAKAMQPVAIEARLEQLDNDYHELAAFPRDRYLRVRASLLDKLAAARVAAEAEAGPDLPLELARRLPEAWPLLTVGERRRIVRALIREIQVARAKGTGKIDPARVVIAWR